MKRKLSKFEERLIYYDWTLVSKEYCGKHMDRVKCYVYKKAFINIDNEFVAYVKITPREAKVLEIGIESNYSTLNNLNLPIIEHNYGVVEDELDYLYSTSDKDIQSKEEQLEVAEIVEAEECQE